MAQKDQQAYHPPTTNGYTRSDEEAMAPDADELRRQKRKKWILYGVAFVVFQTAVIVLFSLTIMKVKNPKFRFRSAKFDTFNVQTTNPSFNLRMNAALGVKNTNFGPYKYDSSVIYFYYGVTQVGSAVVSNSKASFLSTKKFTVTVDLSSTNLAGNSQLASDINSGIVSLTSRSELKGKVELMLIFKKKKSVDLNCSMDLNISTQALQNIQCK